MTSQNNEVNKLSRDFSCLSSKTSTQSISKKSLDLYKENWTYVQCIVCKTGQTFKNYGYMYCLDCREYLTKHAPHYACQMCNENKLNVIGYNGQSDQFCRSCENKRSIIQSIFNSIRMEKSQHPDIEYRFDFDGVEKIFPIIYKSLCSQCKFGHNIKFTITNKKICYPTIICKSCQQNISRMPGYECVNCKVNKVFINECGIAKNNICKNCKKTQDQYISSIS